MEFVDQMNNIIRLGAFPKRIISLVPSQTELLFDLGLDSEVVGITKFCIYPDKWFRNKKRVGGTKTISIEAVRKLNPDLIVGNKEENTKEDILLLSEIAPVWMSDIVSLEDAKKMIIEIGKITNTHTNACSIAKKIATNFSLSIILPPF